MNSLRALAIVVLLIMLSAIAWASTRQALWSMPPEVTGNPWFLATLADAYCGFIIFYAWVAYRETSWFGRGAWLIALLMLGNVASAIYLLVALSRLPANATAGDIMLRPQSS
jgi:hypothetical protein